MIGPRWVFPLLAALLPAAAAATDYPMTLNIDDGSDITVRNGRQVARALARCRPPGSCRDVVMHREPQIDYAANFDGRGYTIVHRLGPPGPEMLARRRGKGNATHFTTAEMIRITSDYIDGRDTPFVRWKAQSLFPE